MHPQQVFIIRNDSGVVDIKIRFAPLNDRTGASMKTTGRVTAESSGNLRASADTPRLAVLTGVGPKMSLKQTLIPVAPFD